MEGLISGESGRLTKVVQNCNERMEEIDHMYDDMQDRVFEIDKNRKNNLVFYGVKGDNTDPDECERLVKSIMNTYMQVTRWVLLSTARILISNTQYTQGDSAGQSDKIVEWTQLQRLQAHPCELPAVQRQGGDSA